MKILALDTSNKPLSIALVEDDALIAETTLNLIKNHSVFVMPVIESLLKVAKWQASDLDRIVVADGPGSYTGIRIAVTTAKTLAATLNIELVGVSSLAVIAQNILQAHQDVNVIAVFDARRHNVFAGGYQIADGKNFNYLKDQHVSADSLIKTIDEQQIAVTIVGDEIPELVEAAKVDELITIANPSMRIPSAYQLALIGQKGVPVKNIDKFVPTYLRITEAEAVWQKSHPGETKESYVREV